LLSVDGKHTFSASSAFFSFHMPPEIKFISPKIGDCHGGTRILVQGVNFINSTLIMCQFGSHSNSTGIFISSTQIMCISPPQNFHHEIPLEISMNGVDYTNSNISFTYRNKVIIEQIWPLSSMALKNGNKIVLITHNPLNKRFSLYCIFNDAKVKAIYFDDNIIQCQSPGYIIGRTPIYIIVDGGAADHDGLFISNSVYHTFLPTNNFPFMLKHQIDPINFIYHQLCPFYVGNSCERVDEVLSPFDNEMTSLNIGHKYKLGILPLSNTGITNQNKNHQRKHLLLTL
jgi:IPT/TIG domain.